VSDNSLKPIDSEFQRAVLELGHLIKYNLYMLTKSIIFHAVAQSSDTPEEAIEATNTIVEELDLEFKKHRGAPSNNE
jgi:hypothetical protein